MLGWISADGVARACWWLICVECFEKMFVVEYDVAYSVFCGDGGVEVFVEVWVL